MNSLDTSKFHEIGRSVPRKEDFRLLTGRGRFGDDFNMPGQAWMVMVRSPHPHARILRIDAKQARAMPGVLAVFTGADCLADGLQPIPHNPVPSTKYDVKLTGPGGGKIFIGPHMLLPADKARHFGEAVAMVVAETREEAEDAADAVQVEYQELPWVERLEDALAAGAPAVWDEVSDNALVDSLYGDQKATDRAFAAADHVIGMEFHIGRIMPLPLEPRAGLAFYDQQTGHYTLHYSTGGPGIIRQKRQFAAALNVKPEQLRLVAYDNGGNFGAKNRPYVEHGLALWASRKLGRPIRYRATRRESMLTEYQGRDLWTKAELAIRADGRFLAMRADNVMNTGAYSVSLSPLAKGAGLITGSYDIPVATLRARAVFTNTVPNNVMRSSGRPEATFAIERLVDMAAAKFGFDRVELRRKNLIRPEQMSYTNALGSIYDSGTYEANMDLCMRIADWNGFEFAAPRGCRARKIARPWLCQLRRILDRFAEGARRYHHHRGGPRRSRHRHATEWTGTRNELRAGRGRFSRGTDRQYRHHSGRYRHREGRRRLTFGTIDASRRNCDLDGGRRPDRERQDGGRRHSGNRARNR